MARMNQGVFKELPLKDVVPTSDNNRDINPKSQDIVELSISIAQIGVLEPVLVRKHPTQKGKWDLRAGARRFHASKLAGLKTIPAIVRDLSDELALEVTIVENFQREDLTPLEEAEGVQKLLEAGYNSEECAKALGYTKQWVYTRAQLTKLISGWKKRAQVGLDESVKYWPVAHLEEIAKCPVGIQEYLLKSWQHWTPDLESLKRTIANQRRELGRAVFDLEDKTLIKNVGSCISCPKRQGAQPDLFGLVEVKPANQDICLDGKCFENKHKVALKNRLSQEQAKDKRTIGVSASPNAWANGEVIQKAYKNRKGAIFQKCKKTDNGALPAVDLSKSGTGRKIYIKLLKSSAQDDPQALNLTVGQQRKNLKEERHKLACKLASDEMDKVQWESVKSKLDPILIFKLYLFAEQNAWDGEGSDKETLDALNRHLEISLEDLGSELWTAFKDLLFGKFSYDTKIKTVERLCEIFGLEWTLFLDEAVGTLPEPPEWKGFKAGDVPEKLKKGKKRRKSAS